MDLNSTTRLLFIGDSITDCGRREDAQGLGSGYVRLVRDCFVATRPGTAPQVLNRGISGNKIGDLQRRWERDVLSLSPDLLSIYIGINDVWHGLVPGRSGTDVDSFLAGYREILAQTKQNLPECKIILCEPSVLWLKDIPGANDKLAPYIDAVHQLAGEFKVQAIVPLHSAFEETQAHCPDVPLTTDGVHPTSAGHMLIAMEWMKAARLNRESQK